MAKSTNTTRESSASPSSSASSCIVVGGVGSRETSAARSSTRATSNTSSNTTPIAAKDALSITRQRDTRLDSSATSALKVPSDDSIRAMSGETLVERVEPDKASPKFSFEQSSILDDKKDNDVASLAETLEDGLKRESTRLSLVATATKNIVSSTASALGKRSREAFDSSLEAVTGNKRTSLRQRVPAKPVSNHIVVEEDDTNPAHNKRTITSKQKPVLKSRDHNVAQVPANTLRRRNGKLWLPCGLYVGQDPNFDARLNEAQRKVKRKSDVPASTNPGRKILPMPMFAGKRLLENGRDFRLPFDLCSPLPPGQSRPEEWRKTRKNVFVGDAASEWKHHKHLPPSRCLCIPEVGCDEDCQNRYMLYECDDTNCNVGRDQCGNRAFADLKDRVKSGNKYDVGVEVMKTEGKGFGVRSNRTFEPNQIIMEYAGEIITQEECERRMRKEYKNNECYYLMVFDQNMIIDATRGSMARFVNHSCEPNCRMVKWTVAGNPRMALFAGDEGIMTGEELTYDYNFDPFSQKNVQECRCGTPSCRGYLGPSSAKPAEGIVAGVKRKIQEVFSGDTSKSQERERPNSKKARVTVSTIVENQPPKQEPVKAQKTKPGWFWEPIKDTRKERIMSSSTGGSTLVEKENILPHSRLRRTSSQSTVSVKGSKITKRTASPKHARRKTVDVLSRVASSIKRNASLVRRSRPSTADRQSKPSSDGGLLQPFARDLQADMESSHLLPNNTTVLEGIHPFFHPRPAGNRPMTATSVKSAAATIRRGVVRSVQGPKRAAAVARIGLTGEGGQLGMTRKTMRLISGEH